MIRKILISALCAVVLGGCASYGYSDGGYYYGRPSVYGGVGYGHSYPYGYGSSYYGGVGYGYPYRYADPYGYYGGYYGGYPYYYYRRPVVVHPRPPYHGGGRDHDGNDNANAVPPWRDLANRVKPRQGQAGSAPEYARPMPQARAERPRLPSVERPQFQRIERPAARERPSMSRPQMIRGRDRDAGLEQTP
jgi:hypothetical protein